MSALHIYISEMLENLTICSYFSFRSTELYIANNHNVEQARNICPLHTALISVVLHGIVSTNSIAVLQWPPEVLNLLENDERLTFMWMYEIWTQGRRLSLQI